MHLQDQAASPYLGQFTVSTHLIYILHGSSVHFSSQFKATATKAFITDNRDNTEKAFCFL